MPRRPKESRLALSAAELSAVIAFAVGRVARACACLSTNGVRIRRPNARWFVAQPDVVGEGKLLFSSRKAMSQRCHNTIRAV